MEGRRLTSAAAEATAQALRHLLPLVLALGCSPIARSSNAEHAARIRALDGQWLAAAGRRDLAGMIAIYAPDAQELLPDLPPLVGRDSIREFYGRLMDQLPRFAHHFEPEEITIAYHSTSRTAIGGRSKLPGRFPS